MRQFLCVVPIALVAVVSAATAPVVLQPVAGCRIECITVPAGSFDQGSAANEAGRSADETLRRVTLSNPFHLGRTPVMRGQFAAFVRDTGYRTEAERGKSGGFGAEGGELVQRKGYDWRNPGFAQGDDHPVVIIAFKDATAFCDWVTRKTGRVCRLPSEAEWEYACRAGSLAPWGAAESADEVAWHKGNSGGVTHAVGSLRANDFGLHDMHGHVGQWCLDWYAPRSSEPAVDPLVTAPPPGAKARRVVRGGSFLRSESASRAAARHRCDPGSRNADIGFRVLVEESATKPALAEQGRSPDPSAIPISPEPAPSPAPAIAPPPPQAREVVVMPVSHFAGLLPLVFLAIPIGLFVIIVAAMVKASSSAPAREPGRFRITPSTSPRVAPEASVPAAPSPASPGLSSRIRIADTGFWLDGGLANPGDHILFRWEDAGGMHEDSVEFTPGARTGGHFVYTGRRALRVDILSVTPGGRSDSNPFAEEPSTQPHDGSSFGVSSFASGVASGWAMGRSTTRHPDPRRSASSSSGSRWPSAY